LTFPGIYRAISEMVGEVALETRTARDIVRKAGLRVGGGTFESGGVSVLSAGISTFFQNEVVMPLGGFRNNFVWAPMPGEFLWWPEQASYGRYETLTDLSACSWLRNCWYIHPARAVPSVNIRVQASLDGSPGSWEYATSDYLEPFEWRYAGANVNAGQWRTYTSEAGDPYTNYPATYPERVGVDNAFPGGLTTSGWHQIRPEFRVEDVHLRWRMDWSYLYDDDPIYTSFHDLITGYGDVQVC
jgi:hypothetical protein